MTPPFLTFLNRSLEVLEKSKQNLLSELIYMLYFFRETNYLLKKGSSKHAID